MGATAIGGGLLGLTACSTGGQAAIGETVEPTAAENSIKVKLAYCSPTGTSVNAALLLAKAISDDVELIDQTSYASRGKEIEFDQDDLVVLVAPTYGGQIPAVDNLWTNLKGNDTPCIVASCFGNRACEMGLVNTQDIVKNNGFKVIGGIKLITQHTTGGMLGRGRPDIKDQEEIAAFAEKIQAKLASGSIEAITIEGEPDSAVFQKYPIGTIFLSSAQKVYVEENCAHCGTCAAECTAGAIDSKTLEINEDVCVHCQRCTSVRATSRWTARSSMRRTTTGRARTSRRSCKPASFASRFPSPVRRSEPSSFGRRSAVSGLRFTGLHLPCGPEGVGRANANAAVRGEALGTECSGVRAAGGSPGVRVSALRGDRRVRVPAHRGEALGTQAKTRQCTFEPPILQKNWSRGTFQRLRAAFSGSLARF